MNEDQAAIIVDYLWDISRDVKQLVEMLKPFLEEPAPVRISAADNGVLGDWDSITHSTPPPDQL